MPYFKKINEVTKEKTSEEDSYWSKFKLAVVGKETGSVDYVDFSGQEPYHIAVTSHITVSTYSSTTCQLYKRLTQFPNTAYGCSFRQDGQMLVAGCEDSIVRVYNLKDKSLLRSFNVHKRPVHRCKFTLDNSRIVSFSDDKKVLVTDIASGEVLSRFEDHSDYIRSGRINPVHKGIIISGSYDHTARLYDITSNTSILKVDHGAPIEDVIFLPSGQIFLTCGGPEVRVWDSIGGGRLLNKFIQHHKTVTSLSVTQDGQYFLSGSLDKHIKIYDTNSYTVASTLDYPAPILSIGVSPDSKVLAAGTTDGHLIISHWHESAKSNDKPKVQESNESSHLVKTEVENETRDLIVEKTKTAPLNLWEKNLKSFKPSAALDSIFEVYGRGRKSKRQKVDDPGAFGLIRELIHKKFLTGALAGRDVEKLRNVFGLLARTIHTTAYTRLVMEAVNVLIDLYGDSMESDPELSKLFEQLRQHIDKEVDIMSEKLCLAGSIEMILESGKAPPPSVQK